MSILPQQPASVSDILSASLKLYVESFTKVIGYSLIVFAVNRAFTIFLTNEKLVDPTISPEEQMAAVLQAWPVLLAIMCIAILASSVCYGATTYRIDNVAKSQEDDFIEVLLLAFKKSPAIILAGILYTIAITVGTLLLVVPGIILMVSLMFCWYFILLEDLSAYDSLVTSHRLVWGDWWRTNIVFFIPGFVFLLVFFVIGFIAGLLGDFTDPTSFSSNALDIVSDLLAMIITPYFYALAYLQYHDLKLRKNMVTNITLTKSM